MTDIVLSGIVVELHVPAFGPAIHFYGQIGFAVVWQRNDAEGYLVMSRGQNILNFYCGTDHVYEHSYFRRFPRDTPRGYGVEIVVPVDDVHGLFARVADVATAGTLGGRIVESLALKPWGKWDFRLEDPFGYYIRVCEPDNWLVP